MAHHVPGALRPGDRPHVVQHARQPRLQGQPGLLGRAPAPPRPAGGRRGGRDEPHLPAVQPQLVPASSQLHPARRGAVLRRARGRLRLAGRRAARPRRGLWRVRRPHGARARGPAALARGHALRCSARRAGIGVIGVIGIAPAVARHGSAPPRRVRWDLLLEGRRAVPRHARARRARPGPLRRAPPSARPRPRERGIRSHARRRVGHAAGRGRRHG
mmetsp:Transcript_5049/g.16202  ORF Transcript_5049/g.16202 Transcript_5049/m.16202 type:complete len:216 (-) Transcript_5049:473-1120(-)